MCFLNNKTKRNLYWKIILRNIIERTSQDRAKIYYTIEWEEIVAKGYQPAYLLQEAY